MADPVDSRDRVEVGFPFRLSRHGRVAEPDYEQHVREMIELVLFTAPGERVNRPDFGCGLLELLFGPATDTVAGATQYVVQGALQRWLGEVIAVQDVQVESRDSSLVIHLVYSLRADGAERRATIDSRGFRWSR